jgi:TonB family protein
MLIISIFFGHLLASIGDTVIRKQLSANGEKNYITTYIYTPVAGDPNYRQIEIFESFNPKSHTKGYVKIINRGFRKDTLNEKHWVYFFNDKVNSEGDYENGRKIGKWKTFHSNGKPDRVETYGNGVILRGKRFDSTGARVDYFPSEEIPKVPYNLNEYLIRNIKYPPEALKQDISGIVYIAFTVNKLGEITNVRPFGKFNELLVEEAVRVVSEMPKWKPGRQENNPVDVECQVPIRFRLTGNH